jgi:formate dehydrogenase major subunit
VDGRIIHQVWMPYHWGQVGLTTGDVVNDLMGVVADPNVFIQESKVLTCDVRPGRRPRGPALLEYIGDYRRRAGITPETGTRILTTGGGERPLHNVWASLGVPPAGQQAPPGQSAEPEGQSAEPEGQP